MRRKIHWISFSGTEKAKESHSGNPHGVTDVRGGIQSVLRCPRNILVSGWRERKADDIPSDVHIVVRLSDYDFINSRLADEEPFELEVNLEQKLEKGPIPRYNTIAEIPGTDKADEVVIISAHMDSWDGPGSQGCTDNGTGSSTTLEAARILAAVGAKPRRTIRFVNWTGEEQGLRLARVR